MWISKKELMKRLTKVGFAKIKFFKKSGARLYLPEKIIGDKEFPFEDEDLVKISIGNDSLHLVTPKWWELLDWNTMTDAFLRLPNNIREEIKEAGLAPK